MLPRALRQAVIAGQSVRQHAQIGRALHIVVTAKDIRAAAGFADVAERQLQNAIGAGVVVADGVLGAAHAPHNRRRPPLGQNLRDLAHRRFVRAGHIFHFGRRPFRHFGADFVHPVDPLANVFFIFPAVLEDVIQNPPDQGDIGTRPQTNIQIGMRRGAGIARIGDNQPGAVFLAAQDMLHRHRMGFGGVGADEKHRLAIMHIVVGIGHRPVAPGVGDPGDGGGMANPRLMIHIVGAPKRGEFAE